MTEHQTGTRGWAEAEARKGAKLLHTTFNGSLPTRLPGAYLGEQYATGWSLYEPAPAQAPDLAAQVAELRDTDMRTVLDAIADLAARLAELEEQFRRHFHMTDPREDRTTTPCQPQPNAATEEALDDIAAGRVTQHETLADLMADLSGPDEPTFTTSRKPDPAPGVLTDDEFPHKALWRITDRFRPLLQAYGRVWEKQAGAVADRGGSPIGALEEEVDAAEEPIIAAIAALVAETRASDRAAREARTEAAVHSACLSYRHDYGLMSADEQEALRREANEWLRAWQKAGGLE